MAEAQVRESVEKVVVDALVDFGFDRSEISDDASLVDLGVSSLDVAELMQIVREEFGVQLQGMELAACDTLNDVVEVVSARTDATRDA